MTAKDLTEKVSDPSVSDEIIFEAVKKYLTDESHALEETERIAELLKSLRPNVIRMFRDLVLSEHKGCCDDCCGNCHNTDPTK